MLLYVARFLKLFCMLGKFGFIKNVSELIGLSFEKKKTAAVQKHTNLASAPIHYT